MYGIWVDKGGNKFRTPYITSFLVAILGAFLYFFGNAPSNPSSAMALILGGRLLSGLGGANQALGYAYIASALPQDQQTRTNTILSMMRIIGMALGPVVNLLLSELNTTIHIFGFEMAVDPLNSVGILLVVGNFLVLTCVVLLLEEPPEKEKKFPDIVGATASSASQTGNLWNGIFKIEIMLPIFILLVINSSFQL